MLNFLKIIGLTLLIGFFYYINNFSEDKKYTKIKEISKEGFSPLKEVDQTNFCQQFIDKGYYYKIWSDTKPQINETHIFCGEINSRGKPTGFHSKIDGKIPETINVLETENKNKFGVYTAKIEVYHIKNKIFKNKFSSIFPDNLSKKEVERAILNAWENKYFYKESQFKGESGLGFEIWGYTYKGENKINTAYPIYKK
ncbi:MAG: EndoU domain-containing protein [Candidatus Gracilibacteria bacterium]|nr:EndoU domain-containing protein [Candidatus Gracilibacteria bacterium]MDQ7022889.1 EndoU domain-containing protein [Candidatus Gracilibacteria bacterium]